MKVLQLVFSKYDIIRPQVLLVLFKQTCTYVSSKYSRYHPDDFSAGTLASSHVRKTPRLDKKDLEDKMILHQLFIKDNK